jgi:arylsulfatase A-like enzyme
LTRLARPVFVATLGFLAASSCRPQTATPPETRRNVLLITIETLRADHVGAYGYERNTTPNLDRLARQGALFRTTSTQAPFTLPSITSVMTGLTPSRHGVRNHPGTLTPDHTTIAERLHDAGYQTAAMTRHTWLRPKSGLDQGFEEYDNAKLAAGLDARSLSLAAIDWLERRRDPDRPFFLWLHFLDPHLPYTPSYPYAVLYRDAHREDPQVKHLRSMIDLPRDDFMPTPYADLSGGPYYDLVFPYYPDNPALLDLGFQRRSRGSIFFGKRRYDQGTVQDMVDLYDGAITYTDDNLGRLMKELADLGLEDSTIVAVSGDHGESFGEHGLYFTHDFTLYDEVLSVPLVLRLPGVIHPGTVVDQQVRLMDLAPTLLDLAQVPPLDDVEAVSLAPLLRGESLDFLDAFAENAPERRMFPENDRVYLPGNRGKWRSIRTERWKLIKIPHPDGDRYELYDLVDDPGETRNLYAELPGEAKKLAPRLAEWIAGDPARHAEKEPGSEEDELEGLDPAALEQLRTLGYIQ